MVKFYKPGERGSNRCIVIRGYINGKQRECRTNTRDEKVARRAWDQLKVKAETEQSRELSQVRVYPFKEVADLYLDAVNAGKNERAYLRKLNRAEIKSRGSTFGEIPIGDIKPMDIAAAANALYRKCKASTKNRHAYTPAASVLHFAAKNDLRDYLVVDKLREEEPETRRPKRGDAAKLLEAADELLDGGQLHALLTFLFCQGWRITETLTLRWDDVDLTGRLIRANVGKVSRWKTVPMHDHTFDVLANLPGKRRGKVFVFGSRWNVYRALKPLCAAAKVKFTPHMARHDFGGSLREAHATPRDLVDVGTWTSEKSTARYQDAGSDHARKVIAMRKPGAKPGGKRASS